MEYSVGIVDYVVIAVSLLTCVAIGYSSSRSGAGRLDKVSEFLLASRQMSMVPTAFSIMATLLSGNAIAGAIGEMYVYGLTSALAAVGGTLTKVLAAFYIVPVFHAIQYTSIYEYMENRFDRSVRTLFAAIYILSNMIYLGTVLYGPAISLTTLSGIPFWITVSCVGLICTLYCVMGGLKAVIWTDVMQALMMFVCVLLVAIQGTIVAGGLGEVFKFSFAKDIQQFNLLESENVRYTVWGMAISSACTTVKSSIVGQAGAQRYLCVNNHKTAAKSLILSSILMTTFKVCTVMCALAIFTLYSTCDPLKDPDRTQISTPDQMYIFAVHRLLSHVPGLQGLALAGLLSASLSTCSSFINSFATITLQDFVKPFRPQWAKTESRNIMLCKLFTFIYGVLAIMMSFAVPLMGGIIQVCAGVSGAALGPLAGAMLVALFSWRANAKACKVAIVVGMVFTSWLTLGSLIYPLDYETLPHSTANCSVATAPGNLTDMGLSMTSSSWTSAVASTQHPLRNFAAVEDLVTSTDGLSVDYVFKYYIFPLHIIPFIWYAPVGMTITYLLALILSQFIGTHQRPDVKFLSPLAAKRMLAYEARAKQRKTRVELLGVTPPAKNNVV